MNRVKRRISFLIIGFGFALWFVICPSRFGLLSVFLILEFCAFALLFCSYPKKEGIGKELYPVMAFLGLGIALMRWLPMSGVVIIFTIPIYGIVLCFLGRKTEGGEDLLGLGFDNLSVNK